MKLACSSLVRVFRIAARRLRLLVHPLLPVLLRMFHLLLELQHLLPRHFRLRARIAQNEADISGDGAQLENLSAAIEVALGTDNMRAFRGVVIANLERESGIHDDAMVVTLHNQRVNRYMQLARQMHSDVPRRGLEFAGSGGLRRRDEPGGNSAIASRGFHCAIHLRQIDAAAGRLKIGGAESADHPDAAAGCSRTNQTRSFADFNFAAACFCCELGSGMLEGNIAAAGIEMGGSLHRSNADVTAAGVQRGIAGDRSDGDMAARRIRGQLARNILGDNVSAARFQVRGATNISGRDVAPAVERVTRPSISLESMLPPPVETSRLEFFGICRSRVTQMRPAPCRSGPSAFKRTPSGVVRAEIVKLLSSSWAPFCEPSVSRWTWYSTVPDLSESCV